MAKVKLDPMFLEIRGRVGDLIFKKSPCGETIVTRVPDMSQVKWSRAQKAQRQRMKDANAYAREAMNDPQMRAYYEQEAGRRNMSPYRLAISSYFKVSQMAENRKALRKP